MTYFFTFAAVPICILTGVAVFSDRQYIFVSIAITICAIIPFFVSFEKDDGGTKKIVMLAVLTALSVIGRFVFMYVPAFKPVTAIVIICGMYLGAEAGFLCGALSAFISNFIFMQGPWTPFQMFIWGAIGFLSALIAPLLKNNKPALVVYAVITGIMYSAFMDIWSVLWWDNKFSLERYAAALISAIPTTAVYAVSNVVFLLLLAKPIGDKLKRVKDKYGI